MRRDCWQRRALCWGSVGLWAVIIPMSYDAAVNLTIWTRIMSFVLGLVAVALTLSAVVVHFMTRILNRIFSAEKVHDALLDKIDALELVWRAGFTAGQQTTGCSMFRPALQLVNDAKEPAKVAHLASVRL